MAGPRANKYIDIQVDAKDLHEYVHENVIWDHVNMFSMYRCQEKKIWRCQGFSCKKQTRYII